MIERLSAEQRVAVRCGAHALELQAAAGSGKTLTLAHRVARFGPDGETQSRLLVVTFTREATVALQRRLSGLMGRGHLVRVQSFHQWAAHELPPGSRTFLDEGEKRRILRDALGASPSRGLLRALGAAPGVDDAPGRLAGVISCSKSTGVPLGEMLRTTHTGLVPWEDLLVHARDVYEERKGDRLDYDDLLLAFRDRIRRDAGFFRRVRSRLDHLFVDEFQDVNAVQADTVRLLTTGRGAPKVTVVGDPRQSIYGFRGGSPEHLERFLDPYGARGRRLHLTTNFRASRALVEASNLVLPALAPTRARLRAPKGDTPLVRPCEDPAHEAREVVDRVVVLLASGIDPAEIAVLARSRHLLGPSREEVAARLGDETWAAREASALTRALDVFLTISRARVAPDALPLEEPARSEARRRLAGLRSEALLDALAWLPWREGGLARAFRVLAKRARAHGLPPRVKATDLLALAPPTGLSRITVSTIHASKGLEWDHVLLVGAREGGLPSEQSLAAPPDVSRELVEEERRLAYVALTRARRSFIATWAMRGERGAHEPCRFLAPLSPLLAPA